MNKKYKIMKNLKEMNVAELSNYKNDIMTKTIVINVELKKIKKVLRKNKNINRKATCNKLAKRYIGVPFDEIPIVLDTFTELVINLDKLILNKSRD